MWSFYYLPIETLLIERLFEMVGPFYLVHCNESQVCTSPLNEGSEMGTMDNGAPLYKLTKNTLQVSIDCFEFE